MNDALTKTELALLEALQRERILLQQRDWVSGIILHELSNAVTVVSGSADLINVAEPGSDGYAVGMQRLQSGSSTLRQLLNGLRELIDSTGAAPTMESTDIVDFVRGLVGDPLQLGDGMHYRIRLNPGRAPARWRISPGLMRHALGNMLRNALRYSTPGSSVSVVIGGRGPRHWIHVLNHGPKLPAVVMARLFEPGKKSATGGMGLGLYIAQTCAERMGGRLVCGTTERCTVFSLVMEDASSASAVVDMMPKTTSLAS
jgi:two-component system OmpR family sensor kinase